MSAQLKEQIPPIRLLRTGVMVAPLVEQIEAHPELWDQNRFRTAGAYGNPHSKLSDIIVRFNDWKNWRGDRAAFNAEHTGVWWKAADSLPYIRPLVFDLMRLVEGERLGMVLLTRIPPYTNCEPHRDVGWHATTYTKYAVSLKANDGQRFCFEDAQLVTAPGDLFSFENQYTHWVENQSSEERITLIICIQTRGPTCMDCAYDGGKH